MVVSRLHHSLRITKRAQKSNMLKKRPSALELSDNGDFDQKSIEVIDIVFTSVEG
jgi:hypothetical protein